MNTIEEYTLDERAENDLEMLELLEQERKWNVISNFKEFISKEPEFTCINNLSSQEILNVIETTTSNKNNKDYPEWHISFLIDLINELGHSSFDINFVKNVYDNIYYKMYI
tara:strand:+ start:2032 stop:2364 length:333 start_codon:yes stop_codon:yes gene_type:complete